MKRRLRFNEDLLSTQQWSTGCIVHVVGESYTTWSWGIALERGVVPEFHESFIQARMISARFQPRVFDCFSHNQVIAASGQAPEGKHWREKRAAWNGKDHYSLVTLQFISLLLFSSQKGNFILPKIHMSSQLPQSLGPALVSSLHYSSILGQTKLKNLSKAKLYLVPDS